MIEILIMQVFTKHLQQDKDNPRSTSKPQTDSLLAQVCVSPLECSTEEFGFGCCPMLMDTVIGFRCFQP